MGSHLFPNTLTRALFSLFLLESSTAKSTSQSTLQHSVFHQTVGVSRPHRLCDHLSEVISCWPYFLSLLNSLTLFPLRRPGPPKRDNKLETRFFRNANHWPPCSTASASRASAAWPLILHKDLRNINKEDMFMALLKTRPVACSYTSMSCPTELIISSFPWHHQTTNILIIFNMAAMFVFQTQINSYVMGLFFFHK